MRRALAVMLLISLIPSQWSVRELAAGDRPYPFGYYGPFHRYPFAYRYYSFRQRTYPLHLWSYPYAAGLWGRSTAYDWVHETLPIESDRMTINVQPPHRLRVADPVNDPLGW